MYSITTREDGFLKIYWISDFVQFFNVYFFTDVPSVNNAFDLKKNNSARLSETGLR